jgi:hypothetical protein
LDVRIKLTLGQKYLCEIQISENRIHLAESVKEGYGTKSFGSPMMMMTTMVMQE